MNRLQTFALALVCQSVAIHRLAIAEDPQLAAPAPAGGAQVVRGTNFTLAKETTRITEPLTAEGYPDYVEHMNRKYSRGVTPKTNAVVLMWQIAATEKVPEDVREEYFRRLGMPVPAETGEYLLQEHDYARNAGLLAAGDEDKLWEQVDEAMRRPWTEKEFPILAKWLAASQRPLKRAVVMSRQPHYYEPFVSSSSSFPMASVLLPASQTARLVARALTCRAMFRLGQMNLTGAWDDVMAVRRLSRLVGQGPFLVNGLVAIAIATLASDAEAAIMHFGRPTRMAISQFRQQRDTIGPLVGIVERLDGAERLMMLDYVCGMERQGVWSMATAFDDLPKGRRTPTSALSRMALNCCVDWEIVLQGSNEAIDRIVTVARIQDYQQRNRAVQRYVEWIERVCTEAATGGPTLPLLALGGKDGRKLAGKLMTGRCIALYMPAFSAILQAEQRIESVERRGEIAMALADYRADHGTYPASLADLVPKYVKMLPRDAFTDAEFRYERTEKGFRLHSIGVNGVNDFGRGYDEGGGPPGDDWLLTMPPKAPVQK